MSDFFDKADRAPGVAARGRAMRSGLARMCCALALLLSACATVQRDVPRPVTAAWPTPSETPLGRAYAPQLAGHDGKSGLHPLPGGLEALATRVALAAAAQHTLDLQYYIVRGDTTTQLLMYRVLLAAQRGVRVRLLVDDLDAAGKDLDLATLAGFPNIEVRLFNPFSHRGAFGLTQVLEFIGNSQRLNRRMHNKLWVADNTMAVIGGRNLGDEYFDAAGDVNFSDLDMLVAGPVVADVSRSFDGYWNSEWAVPIQAFVAERPDPATLQRFEADLKAHADGLRDTDYGRALREGRTVSTLRAGRTPLIVAPVEAFVDRPDKAAPEVETAGAPSVIAARIRPIVAKASRELIFISPYFIPSEQGLETLATLVRKGVRVRALTNSLASADVWPLAHGGYARHRERLIAAGLELYEMRPETVTSVRSRITSRSSAAFLHTKAIVIDRQQVVVGSMNLDPRSRLSNTEIGLVADSRELGATLGRLFDEAVHPARAFRLRLFAPEGHAPALQWATEESGQPVVYDTEPMVGFWRRLFSRLLGAIAPEELL